MFNINDVLPSNFNDSPFASLKRKALQKFVYEKEFQDFAEAYPHLRGLECVEQIIEYFKINCLYDIDELENIPSNGPLVLVANHPIGSLDGLLLIKLIAKVRPDIKVVANQLLSNLKPISNLFIPVDNVGKNTHRQQIKSMHQHLTNQGALLFFPAGEVSRLNVSGVRDGKWYTGFIKLAAKSRAPIVPIHVKARNSPLFYTTSICYKPLSSLLLIREMFEQKNKTVKIKVGQSIPFHNWHDNKIDINELAKKFRKHVYRLGHSKPGLFHCEAPIALAEDRILLKKQIEQSECLGQTPDGKSIYLYQRKDSDNSPVLRELGRLREIAFRAVGEGTGKRRDLDIYDDYYYQLILWDHQELEIVGAYRFLPTGESIIEKGIESIYSHTLFNYEERMMPYLQHGIELGRSFIQPKYWGRRGLDYLWLGIGAFIAHYPHYRYLFGPVSMSGTLPLAARDLMIAFYRLYFPDLDLLATSRNPYPASLPDVLAQFKGDDYQADFTCLKSMLTNLGCAIPTLYKQYTELCEPGGVKFIDFGTDPDFNNSIDGLVLVDLSKLKPARYERYIGVHLNAISSRSA
ncbi:lysophospholipid acyltransferase family protein [Thorsellia anophelis]|uniref:L-ornithine N(alpha)-acyltransferase n=1 Tax=Thorsellia anophelis DSM 18579 TaxID=1123402 RepID=A0A1H9YTL2_9GAMM|nr:lysophospholipid acyltransferase family protein [Thorsellia anophelis]SES72505.1 Putative hemolysin [Thorsellia anophelis DSM 18579]